MASSSTKYPTTGTNDTGVGTVAWSNPGNITLDDGSRATYSNSGGSPVTTNYLKGTNYGFSIPVNATILGIEVGIDRASNQYEGDVVDSRVSIVKANGSIGTTNKASASVWPKTADEYASYGGAADLWGETWTPADINDADFGAVLSATVGPASSILTLARVDTIRITVFYSGSKTPRQFFAMANRALQ